MITGQEKDENVGKAHMYAFPIAISSGVRCLYRSFLYTVLKHVYIRLQMCTIMCVLTSSFLYFLILVKDASGKERQFGRWW